MEPPSRKSALGLLHQYTESDSLRKHALCVEAAMRWYARYFKCDEQEQMLWGITGLLHDFDYERWPAPTAPDGHPFKGNEILGSLGYPVELREAIMGHATYSGVPRNSLMAKTLFAVDELSGFVVAAAMVRPDRSLHSLEPRSILKRMKKKDFARGCNRDDIRQGAEELGIGLEQHIANVIAALRHIAADLELPPIVGQQAVALEQSA